MHTVFIHCVTIKYKPQTYLEDARKWCFEKFGNKHFAQFDNKGDWTFYWDGPNIEYGTQYKFWFKNHEDAMMFSLRWE